MSGLDAGYMERLADPLRVVVEAAMILGSPVNVSGKQGEPCRGSDLRAMQAKLWVVTGYD